MPRIPAVLGPLLALALGIGEGAASPAAAQGVAGETAAGEAVAGQTVADVRAELRVLDGQIQQLRDELVQRGGSGGLPTDAASALTRLDQLEAALRRLTDRVDVLNNDLGRILQDASNRVGDIEFRLTELEGGDPAAAPPGTPDDAPLLGGGFTPPMPRPRLETGAIGTVLGLPDAGATPGASVRGGDAQLAVTEQADFDAAVAAADAGDHAEAAQAFERFLATYPGSPLSSDAQFRRGEALAAQGDPRGAARSFLDAFSGAPDGPVAPRALFRLAGSLADLGQVEEACLTLTEVEIRYPGTSEAGEVPARRTALNCQ